jgi:hypothetical protein
MNPPDGSERRQLGGRYAACQAAKDAGRLPADRPAGSRRSEGGCQRTSLSNR